MSERWAFIGEAMTKPTKPNHDAKAQPRPRTPSDRAVALALARFKRRAADLVVDYAIAGRSTAKVRRSTLQLKADIDSWGDRTGLTDIRAGHSTLTAPPDDDTWTCANCDIVMVSLKRLCFLVGCDPANKNCSYVCLELPKNHRLS
jgi:hypothetical protein